MQTGFTFADVFDDVVARAGGSDSTAEDAAKVRRGLQILLNRWENAGYNTWRLKTLAVVATGASIGMNLPDNVDDVINVTRLEGGGKLDRVPVDRFMTFDPQPRRATPSSWALVREERPRLMLYPAGEDDQLIVWYIARPAHYSVGSSGLDDVPGRWMEAVIMGLAHDLASKRPPYDEQLIERLRASSVAAEELARRADRDRANFRYRIS